MSIRRRLLLVLALSGAVLTGATAAIARLWASGDEARIEAAEAMLDDLVEVVVGDLAARSSDPVEARRATIRAFGVALAGTRRVTAGACDDGPIGYRGRAREAVRAVPLEAAQAAWVREVCASEAQGGAHRRFASRGEVWVVATAGSGAARAWAATSLRARGGVPLPVKLGGLLLGLGAVALAIAAIDALVALRRGAAQLEGALDALGADLGAAIETPRAEELARIADGLRRMAVRLSASAARERALLERLGHEERLAALGRVAAGVAHEVRNPLAGIKLRLDLLERQPSLSREEREDVEACLAEIERIDRLVRSLLGAARREPSVRTGVALAALVEARATALGVPLRRIGEATVATDPDLVTQILDNLLRNAFEAGAAQVAVESRAADRSEGARGDARPDAQPDVRGDAEPDGRAAVRVDVRVEVSERDDAAVVVVADHGPGVDEARVGELFEPFFTTKGDGTGLGLFISRSLARTLGGTLTYARLDGETRFTLALPLR